MRHIGAICHPGPSHTQAFGAIGRELLGRGYKFTLFHIPEIAAQAEAEGLAFWPLGTRANNFIEDEASMLARERGTSLRSFLRYASRKAAMFCELAPAALNAAEVDCVLVDMAEPGGATVAEALQLPYVTICNALPLNQEPELPPDFLPWLYSDAWWAKYRNSFAYFLRDLLMSPLHRVLNRYRRRWGLRPYRRPDDSFSPFAQITQLVPEFDLPRRRLPGYFHYVGPYRRDRASEIPFPYERLDERPLIYASLGTLQGPRLNIWQTVARSCADLDAQLVIALGKPGLSKQLPELPGNPVVVDYAPQRALLARARLAITHAGLNTAMEALAAGVPMVALPITGDQFGVAARIVHSRTGEVGNAARLTAETLSPMISRVLTDPAYLQQARRLATAIERTGGASGAADIIEKVEVTGKAGPRGA